MAYNLVNNNIQNKVKESGYLDNKKIVLEVNDLTRGTEKLLRSNMSQ